MTAEFLTPSTLGEALRLLAEHPEARPLAGGTDLVVAARQGKAALTGTLISIARLRELDGLAVDSDGCLRAGALVSHGVLAASPLVREGWTALADACAIVGSPATRQIGTLGGNLANASPAMEAGAPLDVFGASVELASVRGERRLPVGDYQVAPGRTSAAADELLASILIPALPPRSGSAYLRLEYRRAMEIAVVGAAASVTLDEDGALADVRLALTAVAPTIVSAPVQRPEAGARPTGELLRRLAHEALAAASPITDLRGSAAYRSAMAEVIAYRALVVAAQRAAGDPVAVPASQTFDERTIR